jgi:exodeoxyribonuclease V alpha subunit
MIERLYQQGILSDLEIQFGRFMAELSGGESPEIALAAAMASHYQREGNICFDLSTVSGKPALEDGTEDLVFPKLKEWQGILAKSPVVGRPSDFRPLILDGSRLYLYRYWDYETKLANNLKARTAGDWEKVDEAALKDGLARLFPEDGQEETDWQKVAGFTSVMKRFCVISGGPGTGKTFTVAKILALLLEQPGADKIRIALAAPTGKAAARLQEAIKNSKEKLNCRQEIKKLIPEEASTIHRLLGSVPDSPYFRHNEENPLPAEVVVVDEASMVDLALLSKLVQAVPPSARLILLGDKDQLASVEAGAVLGDICDTGKAHGYSQKFCDALKQVAGENVACPDEDKDGPGIRDSIIQLRRSYRFGTVSGIGEVSRAVNEGDGIRAMELMKNASYRDIEWKELPRPEAMPAVLKDRIIEGFSPYLRENDPAKAFNLFNQFRILCALREGSHGIHYMNLLAEQTLRNEGLIHRDGRWYSGRPVMITRNDYNLRLFNGDVGITLPDPKLGNELRVFFPAPDGSMRTFPPLRLPDHETVYAMTAHKSQGSEFNKVLFLMPDRSVPVLTRELVYTAITRAKEKVEVWGKEEVLKGAISRRIERISGLRKALWG